MSERETRVWRERLEHSHWYWNEKGLTGSGAATVFQMLEWYRGHQWAWEWAGVPLESLQVVNMVFSMTNRLISQLSASVPVLELRPRGESNLQRAQGARISELVLLYFLDELKVKREVDRALRGALLLPFSVVRHGYTPRVEKYDSEGRLLERFHSAKPDLPYVRRVPIWDVRIDPLAETFDSDGDARWCAFRDLVSLEDIRLNPNLRERADLVATVSMDPRELPAGAKENPPKDFLEMVELWTIYDRVEEKFFALSPGSEKPIREPDDWPIPYDGLPFDALFFNGQEDTNLPLAFPEVYRKSQEELNKVSTLMAELVKQLRRVIGVNEDALPEEEKNKLFNMQSIQEFIRVNGAPAEVFAQLQIGGFPQELLAYRAMIHEDIREVLGLSRMDVAQRINVETATEAQGVRQGSAIMSARNEETFEAFWVSLARHLHQGLQATLREDLLLNVAGLADTQTLLGLREAGLARDDTLRVDPERIRGEYLYKIRKGSTVQGSRDAQAQKILALLAALAGDASVNQSELKRLLIEEMGFDSSRLLLSPEALQKTQEILEERGQTEPGPQGGAGIPANLFNNGGGGSPRGSAS